MDTAQAEENHPVKEEEVENRKNRLFLLLLTRVGARGVQPSDKGNEPVKKVAMSPDKVSTEKRQEVISLPEPEKRSENDYSSCFLIPQKKVAQENIEEKSHKEVAEAPK